MYFEYTLPEIFESINYCLLKNANSIDNQLFLEKVMELLKVWNEWVIFDNKFLFGLEALLNRKALNEEFYDSASPLGMKLKFLEEELKSQSRISLEKACKVNGLPISGTHTKLIERLLVLEDYKFKTEKMQETKNTSENKAQNYSMNNNSNREKERESKSSTKNAIAILKNFRNIRHKNMNYCSVHELESYYKVYLEVLRLLQTRAENFDVSDLDGMEFDDVDEYIFNIKKKIMDMEENIDGKNKNNFFIQLIIF